MAQFIMLQGTSSHVGKSIITTALCRIFLQEGRKVVPFKAQNMALNSFVTADGLEMGRAQVAQAEAAGLLPMVDMNPVLLKPTGHASSQVIIDGRPVGNMSAREYHKGYSLKAFEAVKQALGRLEASYDTLVIEGAGSPAEINLKDHDIVNMRVAKYLGAPVLLVADIDRGGSLAALVGTLDLLDDDERALVKGLVINKFRGDVSLFTPAVEFLEKKTGKPVLGVVPYIENLGIDEEDSVSLEDKLDRPQGDKISLAVVQVPKISNFTDFDSLDCEDDTALYYARHPRDLEGADAVILPGSKNTTEDLLFLRENGWPQALEDFMKRGGVVVGICGGYQMMGDAVCDPDKTESDLGRVEGLHLLGVTTTFVKKKLTSQVTADCRSLPFGGGCLTAEGLEGYEIHMGRTEADGRDVYPFIVTSRSGEPCCSPAGAARRDGLAWGTYIHGIFDNDDFRRQFLNGLRRRRGWQPLPQTRHYRAEKEAKYDRLADVVRDALDMDRLRQIMEEGIQ
ncbi:cobyric acid synthase [Megasphaera sp.]|uniref:cobyric acid synthase n=1 Tax=Megasphaera sp. TaxID=2023260 RepID=UPI0025ED7570|nr:cobyric acid synthase [uncultured Megasphaera sp.]